MDALKDVIHVSDASSDMRATHIDNKLEVISIPVSDVDKAKDFYVGLGWRLDADFDNGKDFRVIQFTPPGSGCSIVFGRNVTPAAPGSFHGLLVVSDIEAARAEFTTRSIDASEVFHCAKGSGCRFPGRTGKVSGPHPERVSYGSFFSFSDPDGNCWDTQEITKRLPGRVASETMYLSAPDLSLALQRTAAAHGQHEKRMGQVDPNWADWYAEYMVSEQKGEAPAQ
jgi:catechol 2,3-dioxygenase-like lactoylglutathione lyase family enzyme